MAHKVIHICDRCKSYIESDKDVWSLRIFIGFPAARNKYVQAEQTETLTSQIVAEKSVQREVCTQCAKEITETYTLAVQDPADRLFQGFKLPPLDLEKKIADYTAD
jgi:glutamate dehydrogenase/leucine dehydrogenase